MRIQFLLWLPLLHVFAVAGKCLNDQRSLLIDLKNTLIFDSTLSTKLSQWNPSTDCCDWPGVTCNAAGRVIGLNLTNEAISGGFSNSPNPLFSLRYIQSLNLAYNNFQGTLIPSGFANLTALTYLNLSNAGFVGQIPVEISQLGNLVSLDLSSISFPGVTSLKLEKPDLGMFIGNLIQLTELHLDGVNISAQGSQWCLAISSLSNLRVLSLTSCYLSGPIDSSISKLGSSLSVIRLDQNNLSSQVPEFFGNFTNLTSLRLSSCQLSGLFPPGILQVPTLQTLDVSANKLLVGYLPEFPPDASLQTLVLRETNFSGHLPDSIGNLGKLSRLEVTGCQFNGSLPIAMSKLTQLVYVDLSSNGFTGSIPQFNMSKNLNHLDLSHNSLNGSIWTTNWEGLGNLVHIDLRFNALGGSIPSSIFSLPLIQKIQVSSNQFDGQLAEFSNASSSLLDTLDLSSNRLEGPIPNSVFELGRLNILSMSSNKFNGTIHLDMIGSLGNLTKLELSYNNLSVSVANGSNSDFTAFPQMSTLKLASCKMQEFPNLKDQMKLNVLDLSDNQLMGEVPNWIWKLGGLSYLNLSNNLLVDLQQPPHSNQELSVLDVHLNKLSGKIPIVPPTATYVDYSRNKFSDIIPADIGNYLIYTIFFSLSNNGLTGELPKSICNASYLQVLDVSNNNLSGSIQPCVFAMSKTLAVLNLRENHLTGHISDTFPTRCALRTLDLNGNILDGLVPKSLANCSNLEVLDIGNNQIGGKFPCLLKNISTLRVLVLRSNKFYGALGCQGINGTWSMLQIVDLASNNFSGKIPGNCLKTWEAMKLDEDGEQSRLKHLQFAVLSLSKFYYQDSVTITSKGLEMELVKILTVYTSVDLSCNNFSGPIPDTFGELKALYVLNLSQNALIDQIPTSIGNLQQLESLDLSRNNLEGEIPIQLAGLTFLSVLNLSYNHLKGRIPLSTQLQSFTEASYRGNQGLCGAPLTPKCAAEVPASPSKSDSIISRGEFDWQFIFTGLGFGVGSGMVVAPVTLWKKGRKWGDKRINHILMAIFPMFGLVYMGYLEAEKSHHSTVEENEMEKKGEQYCVFCTKLGFSGRKAIHDPECRCHQSPPTSFSSSSSSLLSSP